MTNIIKEMNGMNTVYTDLEEEANVEHEFQEERMEYHEVIAYLTKMAYETSNDIEFGAIVRRELKSL